MSNDGPVITHKHVEGLRLAGEGQHVEFKETTGPIKEACRTLSAFANQAGGGVILIGVKDDGQLHGGFTIGRKTQADVANGVRRYTMSDKTGLALTPVVHVLRNPDILVLEVPPTAYVDGPYRSEGDLWHRVGAATLRQTLNFRELAKSFNSLLQNDDPKDPFGVQFCPHCGRQRNELKSDAIRDWQHDRLYHVIECPCGWKDWTE